MENVNLSPEKSFELINQIINQARNKFEENGFIFMFWGLLMAITSISQFVLLKNEYYDINWYPYSLMPIGSIYTGFYFAKRKGKSKQNLISKMVSFTWIVLSFNLLILGAVFGYYLKQNLIPIILILLAIGVIVSGTSVKSRLLIYSGTLINISAFVCFYIDWIYQPLLMSIVSILAFFIPGLLLMIKYKKAVLND
jgi:hypothetical protein